MQRNRNTISGKDQGISTVYVRAEGITVQQQRESGIINGACVSSLWPARGSRVLTTCEVAVGSLCIHVCAV